MLRHIFITSESELTNRNNEVTLKLLTAFGLVSVGCPVPGTNWMTSQMGSPKCSKERTSRDYKSFPYLHGKERASLLFRPVR